MNGSTIPSILVVDDSPLNIDVLLEILGDDYDVSVAMDGESALKFVEREKSDLILLDVMMPGMDGHEVCRQLNGDPETADIPIIFITTLDQSLNEVKGLELGAVDYIAKPFVPAILKCRINTQLKLRRMQRELRNHNENLEELVQQRTHELATANERLKELDSAKNDFLAAISHELRTPANGVLGIASLAIDDMKDPEQQEELQDCFEQASDRLLQTINSALLLARLETEDSSVAREEVALAAIIAAASENLRPLAEKKNKSITIPTAAGKVIRTNQEMASDVARIMFKAALLLASDHTDVETDILEDENETVLQLTICGETLPEEVVETFFDTFSSQRASSRVEELGLTIPLAKRLMEIIGGTVDICNIDRPGIQLSVHFPEL